jgi:hypothetical protein
MQGHPLVLKFKRIPGPTKLGLISDSAFKATEPDCLAIRSGIIALMTAKPIVNGTYGVVPIEWVSKKQQRICRSTYSAEMHSALDLIGLGLVINSAFNEVMFGSQSAAALAQRQEEGLFAIPAEVFIDARSVWETIAAEVMKTPSDHTLLIHAKAVKQYFLQKQLKALTWIDTRDMVADALNKGIVDRVMIRRFFSSGEWTLQHAVKTYDPHFSKD